MESIKKSVADLTEHFNSRMAEFQKDLKNAIPATSPTSNINHQFNTFRVLTALENLQLQVELLTRQCDDMEMRSRRKILLVHGVAEDKKENTSACVVKLLSDHLGIPDISSEAISRSHRLGQPGTEKPRAILVKFNDFELKDKIWLAKKKLKGTDITLSEFLTKGRHAVFQAARQRFGISRCWTRDGAILVLGSDQTRHRIWSRRDLDAITCIDVVPQPQASSSVAATGTSVAKDVRPAQVRPKRVIRK